MEENWLQIREYVGEGFCPLVAFDGWRVAILNYLDGVHPENNTIMERHTETDEVFVLTKGEGMLLIGGNGAEVGEIHPQRMEAGKIYNVRCNVWHTILLSRDGTVLLVENRDTGDVNSEFYRLSPEQHRCIREFARQGSFG